MKNGIIFQVYVILNWKISTANQSNLSGNIKVDIFLFKCKKETTNKFRNKKKIQYKALSKGSIKTNQEIILFENNNQH
jgi:hypothetical protein